MTLDYERKGIYLLNESALDDFVDKQLELQAQLSEQTKLNRWQAESLKAFRDKFGVPSNCQALDAIDALYVMATPNNTQLAQMQTAASELCSYVSYAEIVGGISINRAQIREWCDKLNTVLSSTTSSTEWLSRHDTQQLELSCRELIALMDKRPELSQCVEPWESVRKALSRKLAEAKQEFAENLIQEVRPYAQITINGEHLVFEDWLRARAAALTPAGEKAKQDRGGSNETKEG